MSAVFSVIQNTAVVYAGMVTTVLNLPPARATLTWDAATLNSCACRIAPTFKLASAREVTGIGIRSPGVQKETDGSVAGPPAAVKPFESVPSIWNWYQLTADQGMPRIE